MACPLSRHARSCRAGRQSTILALRITRLSLRSRQEFQLGGRLSDVDGFSQLGTTTFLALPLSRANRIRRAIVFGGSIDSFH